MEAAVVENPGRSRGLKYPSKNPNKPQSTPIPNPNQFPSHKDAPNVSSTARTLCDILTRTSPQDIETAALLLGNPPLGGERERGPEALVQLPLLGRQVLSVGRAREKAPGPHVELDGRPAG
ncbi:pentatricopeptide repeat-containing protein mitochondrial [Spatholobus suberectus]|nr:pentatricopeptide repeat-containing protein mitochondrial [Spatholobus suberectus]